MSIYLVASDFSIQTIQYYSLYIFFILLAADSTLSKHHLASILIQFKPKIDNMRLPTFHLVTAFTTLISSLAHAILKDRVTPTPHFRRRFPFHN